MRARLQGEYIVIDSDNIREDEVIRKYRDALNLRVLTFSCSPTLDGGIDKFGILIAPDNGSSKPSFIKRLKRWFRI